MDIKAKIDEIVNKIKSDPDFAEEFKADPVKAAEGVLGVDLPDDIVKNVVDAVKSNADGIKDKLGGIFGG